MKTLWRATGMILACVIAIQPAPTSTTATPVAESTASPATQMLSRLPDLPLGKDGAMVTYADFALQAGALGIDAAPRVRDEEATRQWLEAVGTLALPQTTGQHWSRPEWRDAFGFDLSQVEQAVEYAAPPLSLTIVRGSFDPAELRAAWATGGYTPIDLGAGEAYAVRDDFAVDIADPGSRMALAYFNVAALTDDGSLLFGSSREIVSRALVTIGGEGASFADRADVQPLLQGAPEDLASAILLHGKVLQANPDPAGILLGDESPEEFMARAEAERAKAQALPPIVSALIGQTAGSFPSVTGGEENTGAEAALVAVLATTSAAQAEHGAAVIAERLETETAPANVGERPWAEMFQERSVHAVPGEPAIQIALRPAPDVSPFILQTMIFQRAPGFLGWSW